MAKREYFKAIPAVYVVLLKDDKLLMLCRKNTSYYDGSFSLPAGHVEQGESLRTAAVREAREETGVIIKKEALSLVHVINRPAIESDGDTRLDFFFMADRWQGTPQNMEPEKCSELSWFAKTALPKDIIPEVRQAIEHIFQGGIESEFGWA